MNRRLLLLAKILPARKGQNARLSRRTLAFCVAGMLAVLAAHGTDSASDSAKGLLLVTNKGDKTLSLVDPATDRQITVIPEDGNTGHELAASADGKLAFVPIYGDSGVGKAGSNGQIMRVIDLGKREIVATVDFGKGVRPHCPVLDPKSGMLYVTTELENSVSVIDPATLKIVGSIPTGEPESHMLAISHDGRRGYTANVASGTVSVLDLESRKLLTTIPVSSKTQRISITPDDRWVFTADQSKPQIAVIDTQTNQVASWIPLADFAYGTAVTPDGRTLIATMGLGDVAIIDLQTKKVTHTLQVPRAPQEVLVRPDGAVAYVSCDASHQIAVLDLKEWKVKTLIDVGQKADGLAWAKAE